MQLLRVMLDIAFFDSADITKRLVLQEIEDRLIAISYFEAASCKAGPLLKVKYPDPELPDDDVDTAHSNLKRWIREAHRIFKAQ